MQLYLPFEKFFMKKLMFGLSLLISTVVFAQNEDESAIRQMLAAQTKSWNSGNLESFMQPYWKSDSLMFVGKNGVVWGWQQTLDNYKKGYPNRDAMGQLTFDIIVVKKLSDAYYHVTGKWMLKRTIGDVSGHYTLLLRRIAGEWKIVYDHSS
jgi:ketosteroid isomerase-like protein